MRAVGAGATDRRSIEFLARVQQTGRDLSAVGWLTHVQGLSASQLVTGATPVVSTDPAASDPGVRRLTVVVDARLQTISALGSAITGHGVGRAAIHLLRAGGARLEDPGVVRGRHGGRDVHGCPSSTAWRSTSPDRAGATFRADFVQRSARVVTLGGRREQLGRPALPWSVRATGRGERSDPVTPRSEFFLSGDLGVDEAGAR